MEKGDTVRYLGTRHPILVKDEEYEVFSVVGENGLQLVIPTGFAGVSIDDVILVKIKG